MHNNLLSARLLQRRKFQSQHSLIGCNHICVLVYRLAVVNNGVIVVAAIYKEQCKAGKAKVKDALRS